MLLLGLSIFSWIFSIAFQLGLNRLEVAVAYPLKISLQIADLSKIADYAYLICGKHKILFSELIPI